MQIEKVLVFRPYDVDIERKTLLGLSVGLLSAVDRVEFHFGSNKKLELKPIQFASEHWFDEFLALWAAVKNPMTEPTSMDPQACLLRIIDLVRGSYKIPQNSVYDWSDLTQAFEDLARWLKSGGTPPHARGPVFGTVPQAVGYPGITANSLVQYQDSVIRAVRSSPTNAQYTIAVGNWKDNGCELWQMREYQPTSGALVAVWDFPQEPANV